MPLCYKGRSIDVVLGNTIVYFAYDRKHTHIYIYIYCVWEKFCNVVERGVYSIMLKGLKYPTRA